jgi:ribosomal protein S18 acetylase RimI-like enzyme
MTFANTPPNTPQTNPIITRLATLSDLARIAPLFNAYRQFYEQADDLAVATTFIHDRLANAESVIILALDGAQKAVGFCQLYPTFCSVEAAPIYTLYDLFVSPQARRTGAARALLRAADACAAQTGRVRMDLTTARTNSSAQALYESEGWVQDAVFLTYNKAVFPI